MFVVRKKKHPSHYYYGDGAFVMDIDEAARWKQEGRAIEWIKFNKRDDLEVVNEEEIQLPLPTDPPAPPAASTGRGKECDGR